MAKLKGNHASKKAQRVAYKALNKAGKNKAMKLARHLKKFPNDSVAAAAVKTARDHTGRKAPKRTAARLNPYIHDKSMIALAEVMIEEKQVRKEECIITHRSLNTLSGRISALGKRVAQHQKLARKVANEAQFDRKGNIFPKPKLTQAERDLAKARALGKNAEQSGVSKAKQKKLKNQNRRKAA